MDARLRFFKYVHQTTKCWEWIGSLNNSGYGTFNYLGKNRLAHRVSYILHVGNIPAGQNVCHKCDNRRCVRPDHFFLGTAGDNNHDAIIKGRARILHGEAHGNAKLNDNKVRNIREQHSHGESFAALARHYLVSDFTIKQAVLGKTWVHVK